MHTRSAAVVLAIAVFTLPGCGDLLRAGIVNAPNRGDSLSVETDRLKAGPARWGIDHQLYVDVGPPEATLRLWIREPVDAAEPRGTILVLHGWRGESFWIRGTARKFAEAGYRAVLVDARGHGGSSGDYITFGVQESRDLVQVLDALHRHDLADGPVGVWGVSTGATTAIMWAAGDDRVEAVAAVAPFTNMREVTRHYMRLLMPVLNFFSDESLDRHTLKAAETAGFDADEADALLAIEQVEVPVLIAHGKRDLFVPQWHGRVIQTAGRDVAEFVGVEFTTHITAHFSNAVFQHTLNFFNRTLAEPDLAPDSDAHAAPAAGG